MLYLIKTRRQNIEYFFRGLKFCSNSKTEFRKFFLINFVQFKCKFEFKNFIYKLL